ncbi:hypothetical protein Q4566_09995 [Tamlana sp. 2_MG-2023]|uniref:hypothetical protein n=1 Tax=unclassified Tamlana TaxID=2614803 RepID=UPI0026E30659|nr:MULTISPECIES: hypothetical protein [unclassified Tamlana]MDO6760529.1 hypothetical protein [Tamlana sp. 2_MG-2023]MDO6790785.1 hypothetical protein [Tamlana sp. 1_MG-2023]
MNKLSTQKINYLTDHFKTWLLTEACKETFNHILEKIVSYRILENEEEIMDSTWDKGSLSIELQTENSNGEQKIVRAIFAPSTSANANDVIESLHSEVLLIDTEDDLERLHYPSYMYHLFTEDEDEETTDRFLEFCDLGQNCAVIDTENLNSLKEPKICFFSHGGDLEDSEEYSGQDENSYNQGGYIFRVLAYFLYSDEKSEKHELYEEFNCG